MRRPTQLEPNSAKASAVKADAKKTKYRGSDKKSSVLETGTVKNKLSRKLTQLSLRFQKTSG